MRTWEGSWQVGFPVDEVSKLLLALVVRDLLHGASFDVELEGTDDILAVDVYAGDDLEEDTYQMLIAAEVQGPEKSDTLQAFMETLLEETIEEAEGLVEAAIDLGSRPGKELEFVAVPEDDERWDLVVPDWLAPDGAEVPFGFRPVTKADGEAWPGDDVVAAHGRVIVVPWGDGFQLFGIPAPAPVSDEDES